MTEGLILGGAVLLFWGGHWMPWRVAPFLVDRQGKLYRPLAYGYGCVGILAGFAAWAFWQAETMPLVDVWAAVVFLVKVVIAAGVGTMAPRLVKWVEEYQALVQDRTDYEQALEEHRPAA